MQQTNYTSLSALCYSRACALCTIYWSCEQQLMLVVALYHVPHTWAHSLWCTCSSLTVYLMQSKWHSTLAEGMHGTFGSGTFYVLGGAVHCEFCCQNVTYFYLGHGID